MIAAYVFNELQTGVIYDYTSNHYDLDGVEAMLYSAENPDGYDALFGGGSPSVETCATSSTFRMAQGKMISIAIKLKCPSAPASASPDNYFVLVNEPNAFRISINSLGHIVWTLLTDAGDFTMTSSVDVCDGNYHTILCNGNGSEMQIFTDGVGTTPLTSVYNSVAPNIIEVFAGDGTSGYSGDGGAATSAELDGPDAICVDSSGNVFFTDTGNGCIRKVDASGIITTFCTVGVGGGLCIDDNDNLYAGGIGINYVHMITPSAVITVFAGTGTASYTGDGGPATSATINTPRGLCFSDNCLYIADSGNSVIRKVDQLGTITTFAGTGTAGNSGNGDAAASAEFNTPTSLAADSSGNIYITDSGNHNIRVVNTDGTVLPLAGDGTGTVGGLAANFGGFGNNLAGLYVDPYDNIYISDTNKQRVYFIGNDGVIKYFAGNGTAGLSGMGGLAMSAEIHGPAGITSSGDTVYLCGYSNHMVFDISTSNGNLIVGAADRASPTYYVGALNYVLISQNFMGSVAAKSIANCQTKGALINTAGQGYSLEVGDVLTDENGATNCVVTWVSGSSFSMLGDLTPGRLEKIGNIWDAARQYVLTISGDDGIGKINVLGPIRDFGDYIAPPLTSQTWNQYGITYTPMPQVYTRISYGG